MSKCEFLKLLWSLIEVALQHDFLPVNLLDVFRTSFLRDIPGRLLLQLPVRPSKGFRKYGSAIF